MALVDPEKIGLGITVFVSIETGDHSQDWLERFAEVVGAMPEVMEFYRMAGDVDYMLRVVVHDMQGYDAFYKKLIATVPLKNVTSRFAMERIKSTTALPIVSRSTIRCSVGAVVGRRRDARAHVHLVGQVSACR